MHSCLVVRPARRAVTILTPLILSEYQISREFSNEVLTKIFRSRKVDDQFRVLQNKQLQVRTDKK